MCPEYTPLILVCQVVFFGRCGEVVAHWREPRNDAPFCARERASAGGWSALFERAKPASLRDCPHANASEWAQGRKVRGRVKGARSL